MTVRAFAGGAAGRFVLDTGIGVSLVTESLAARIGAPRLERAYTGRRMSGQEVSVPLVVLPDLRLESVRRVDLVAGVLDLDGLGDLDGFLSLEFFRHAPFTVDYEGGAVVVESPESLEARASARTPVAIELEDEGCSLDAFIALVLPDGREVSVEVDMGSDSLILDESLALRSASTSEPPMCVASRESTRPGTRTCARSRASPARSTPPARRSSHRPDRR